MRVSIDAACAADASSSTSTRNGICSSRDERLGVARSPVPTATMSAPGRLDLVVALAQLRGMLAAVQSTEVSQEHQHDRLVAPEIAEPVRACRCASASDVSESAARSMLRAAYEPGRVLVSFGSPARSRQARIASATIVSVGP